MRLTPAQAARIKACQGVYGLRDTARHFNCSPTTVHNVWTGKAHREVYAASEPPNVIATRIDPTIIAEDGRTLLERGMTAREAAEVLGVGKDTVYKYAKSPSLVVYP